jgi:hypothetical protein
MREVVHVQTSMFYPWGRAGLMLMASNEAPKCAGEWIGGSGPNDVHSDPGRVDVFPSSSSLIFIFIIVANGHRRPLSIHPFDVTAGFWELVWIEREESVQLRVCLGWHKGLTGRGPLGGFAIRTSLVCF